MGAERGKAAGRRRGAESMLTEKRDMGTAEAWGEGLRGTPIEAGLRRIGTDVMRKLAGLMLEDDAIGIGAEGM